MNYGKNHKGKTSAVNDRLLRRISRRTGVEKLNSSTIKRNFNMDITSGQIGRKLKLSGLFSFGKDKPKPVISNRNKALRLEFARSHLNWTVEQWKKIIFSDEKRFCLDGPDGTLNYQRCKRSQKMYSKKRHTGGGSCMFWGAFCNQDKSSIKFIELNLDARGYTELLEEELVPFYERMEGCFYQHDNARCHTANFTTTWLRQNSINIFKWPAQSPDLNPIENLWSYMTYDIYKDAKQYDLKSSLKERVLESWNRIPVDYLETLISSMPHRLEAVIRAHGGPIDY